MSEYRQNLATKEWIIIAAERKKRPDEFLRTRLMTSQLPAHDSACPFCPGHEAMTPPAKLTVPPPEVGSWQVRVVANKFPALAPDGPGPCLACSTYDGPYLRREGVGDHEVIIESPLHNRDLPTLSPAHMRQVVQAYHQRYLALTQFPATGMVVVFRNHGVKAGTSIIHPHSQIVASSVVPFQIRNKLYEGQRYHDQFNRCVYCDIIAYELEHGERIVMRNEHFIALAPYASSVPYEVWLLPVHHHPTFGPVETDELCDLADTLQNLLARLWRLLGDPDYNFVIDTAPEHMAGVPSYHWHLEIFPKLTTPAGFEIGSGIGINIVPPEQAAAELREADGSQVQVDEDK